MGVAFSKSVVWFAVKVALFKSYINYCVLRISGRVITMHWLDVTRGDAEINNVYNSSYHNLHYSCPYFAFAVATLTVSFYFLKTPFTSPAGGSVAWFVISPLQTLNTEPSWQTQQMSLLWTSQHPSTWSLCWWMFLGMDMCCWWCSAPGSSCSGRGSWWGGWGRSTRLIIQRCTVTPSKCSIVTRYLLLTF